MRITARTCSANAAPVAQCAKLKGSCSQVDARSTMPAHMCKPQVHLSSWSAITPPPYVVRDAVRITSFPEVYHSYPCLTKLCTGCLQVTSLLYKTENYQG
jgi:hypothetical protein